MGSEMCIRDSERGGPNLPHRHHPPSGRVASEASGEGEVPDGFPLDTPGKFSLPGRWLPGAATSDPPKGRVFKSANSKSCIPCRVCWSPNNDLCSTPGHLQCSGHVSRQAAGQLLLRRHCVFRCDKESQLFAILQQTLTTQADSCSAESVAHSGAARETQVHSNLARIQTREAREHR